VKRLVFLALLLLMAVIAPAHDTQPTPELAKTSPFLPWAWNLIAPTCPKPAETGFCPVGQIPLPVAPAQSWNLPEQIPLPLVGLQTKGNQLPGIWICKDRNGDTVFSNRTWQYGECRPYVASPGLREAFLEEMLLKRKQHTPQHAIPDQSSTKSNVIGPL
jgi:hypothetical protein